MTRTNGALRSITYFIALLAGVASAQVTRPIPGDPVRIDAGLVSGTVGADGLRNYFGIPFAAPPVRENRWRAPQPVQPWQGVLTANRRQAECTQGLRSPSINHYFIDELAGEDCLTINVWAPADAQRGVKLPVIVWIYGGAFVGGSATSPIYDGSALVKRGHVIYVAANYRLGVMGFLAHPELTRESAQHASGNWGFLDQVAALQWVQRNIAAFGGDPGNVTLLGQSAGSMSINNLQASPLARGLFQRVFGLSGSTLRGGAGQGVPLAEAEQQGLKLQAALNAHDIAGLRSVSSDKIMATAQQAGVRAGPDIDGHYLPESVDAIFAAGRQSDVPVVTGSTANDIGTAVPIRRTTTLAEYQSLARQMYGDKAEAFLALYPAKDDAEARRQADQVARNSGFAIGARNWARAQTRTGHQPAYLFMVSRVQPFTAGVKFSDFDPATAGAYHMGDVPYFLGTYESFNLFRPTRDWTPLDRELSLRMQDVILAFARTGNPSTADVKFTRYDPANEMRIDFGDRIVNEPLYTRGMDFIDASPVQLPPRPAPAAPPASGTVRLPTGTGY